jgi:hypothetical protein
MPCGFFHLTPPVVFTNPDNPSQAIDSLPDDADERFRCYSANNPIAAGL